MKNTIDHFNSILAEIEDYAILLLDEKGNVKDWNKGAEKLKGYKAEEIIDKNFRLFYTAEDQQKKLPEELLKKALETGKASDEGWRLRKDGSCFWGSILITALHDEKNKLKGFLKITRDLSERKALEEKLRQANDELEQRVQDRTAKLIASEKQFRHTLDNMLEGAQIHDFNWRYIYVNDALVKHSTYQKKEELLGYTLMEIYPGIEQTEVYRVMQRCMNERIAEQLEIEFDFPNGTKGYFDLSIQPIPEGIFILSNDISKRKKAEEELQKSISELSQYKFAIDTSSIVARTDQNGIIEHVNENFCKISKYSEAELLGQDHRIINSAYHPKEYIRNLWATIAKGKVWKGELRNKAKDGTIYWVDTTIVPLLHESGKPHQYLAIRADITERKKAEEELLKANRLYALLSAVNQSIVHIKDEKQLLDKICDIAIEIGNFKVAIIGLLDEDRRLNIVSAGGSESLAKRIFNHTGVYADDPMIKDIPDGKALRTGKYAFNNDMQADEAHAPWKEEFIEEGVHAGISLPIMRHGQVAGIFSLRAGAKGFFDKTEIALLEEAVGDISFALGNFDKEKLRLEAEAKILQEEIRLKQAQAIAQLGSWQLDLSTSVVLWSDELCRLFGVSTDENKQAAKAFLSFVHPEDRDFVSKAVDESNALMRDVSFDHRVIRKDGELRYFHSERRFEFDNKGKPIAVHGIAHDITNEKLSEKQREFDKNNLDALINNTNSSLWSVDRDYKLLTYNQPLYEIMKNALGKELEKGADMLSYASSPEQAGTYKKFYERAFAGEAFTEIDSTGASFGVWSEVSFYPIREGDKIIGSACNLRDITERIKAENQIKELNETLEERVQQRTADLTEANKSLEAFTGPVSHDLRAPVRAVNSFAKIIQQDYGNKMEPQQKELFQYIEENGRRMGEIIDDLLKLAKYGHEKLKIEPVDMGRLINGIWLNIGRTTTHHAQLELGELPTVNVDMGMIQQVVVNLLTNGIKYSSKVPAPVIKIWCEKKKGLNTFYFKDNGAGFDMQHHDRLFGAFQRLHNTRDFEGTGVGLTLVKRIIEKHGGTVGAEGKVGEGATFYFTLPLQL